MYSFKEIVFVRFVFCKLCLCNCKVVAFSWVFSLLGAPPATIGDLANLKTFEYDEKKRKISFLCPPVFFCLSLVHNTHTSLSHSRDRLYE